MDLLGKYVKKKETNDIGVITSSSFGYSIHTLKVFNDDDLDKVTLVKYLGDSWENHSKHWEIIEELPEGYDKKVHGVPTTEDFYNLYHNV